MIRTASFEQAREESLKYHLLEQIRKNGGWVNAHCHADRAFTVTPQTFAIYQEQTLVEKWDSLDRLKRQMRPDDYYRNFSLAAESMIRQGVQAMGSFIDCDPVSETRAIEAALKARETYKDDITIKLIAQPLKGIIDSQARYWFEKGADLADIIGGLPFRDERDHGSGKGLEHMDYLLKMAKAQGKMLHAHIDQFNSSNERETEQLAEKTIEYGMQGKVAAIHCISIAAHEREYRQALYKKIKDADLIVIACPFAWIDTPRSEVLMPFHNALTPVDELMKAGIKVALGTDNISDHIKPFSLGDMWPELELMISGCRYTDMDGIVRIATENGRKALNI